MLHNLFLGFVPVRSFHDNFCHDFLRALRGFGKWYGSAIILFYYHSIVITVVATIISRVEPLFNEALFNKLLGITNNIFQPGKSYSKMYGTEPLFNELLDLTNRFRQPKLKIYSI